MQQKLKRPTKSALIMIRKIAAKQLLPGMFVVDLHCRWLETTFWRTRFLIEDDDDVARIQSDGINEVPRHIDGPAQ